MKTLHKRNADIGRKGGMVKSTLKSLAARQNALLRWHGKSRNGIIPPEALIDGAWYRGKGRTAPIAMWDASTSSFHTIGINSYPDPKNYPQISRRVARLKQETHVGLVGGSFAPLQIIANSFSLRTSE